MSDGYEDTIRGIFAQDLDDDDLVGELAELCETVVSQAFSEGQDKAHNELQDDLHAAETEWREIVESFKRGDMPDVRSRLMDLGTRIFNVDLWIPSR